MTSLNDSGVYNPRSRAQTGRRVKDDLYFLSTCMKSNRMQTEHVNRKLRRLENEKWWYWLSHRPRCVRQVWFTLQFRTSSCGPKPRSATTSIRTLFLIKFEIIDKTVMQPPDFWRWRVLFKRTIPYKRNEKQYCSLTYSVKKTFFLVDNIPKLLHILHRTDVHILRRSVITNVHLPALHMCWKMEKSY